MNIRIKPGAWVASVNTSEVFTANISINTDAVLHKDEETNDFVCEFEYNGRMWTVDIEHVEIISDNTPKQINSAFITPTMTDAWERAWRRATGSVK